MPAGKISKIKTVEGWPVTPVTGTQTAGRSVGITLDRELFLERGDIIAHTHSAPRDTRRLRARIFWLHDAPLKAGASILVRLGTMETRASVVAIEKAVDPGELASVETTADRTQSCRRDRSGAGQTRRGRCLHRQSAHRTSGHRKVNGPHRRRGSGPQCRSRPARRAGRYCAGGICAAAGRAYRALSSRGSRAVVHGIAGLGQIHNRARAGTPPGPRKRRPGRSPVGSS